MGEVSGWALTPQPARATVGAMKLAILSLYVLAALFELGAALLAFRHSGLEETSPGSMLYEIPKKFVAGTVLAATGVVIALFGNGLSLLLE